MQPLTDAFSVLSSNLHCKKKILKRSISEKIASCLFWNGPIRFGNEKFLFTIWFLSDRRWNHLFGNETDPFWEREVYIYNMIPFRSAMKPIFLVQIGLFQYGQLVAFSEMARFWFFFLFTVYVYDSENAWNIDF